MRIGTKLAQQIVNTVKDVCGFDINFIDEFGTVFASTDRDRIGQFHEIGQQVARTKETIEVIRDDSFLGTKKGVNIPVFHNGLLVAVIGISGDPDEVRKYAYLAVRITMLLIREQELEAYNRSQKDRMGYVIQSLLSGEAVNREYLTICLNDMKISEESDVRCIYFKLNTRYNLLNLSLLDQKLIQLFHVIQSNVYTYRYPDEYIAIVPDSNIEVVQENLKKFSEEYGDIIRIAVGKKENVYKFQHSYETAQIAMASLNGVEHGRFFITFDELDIHILLGSLEPEMKKNYLNKTINKLSEEEKELLTIYYEEEMSLSTTCKRLFLHKNTLQYKLDKIARVTGYNPRKFKDAVVLYLAINIR